MVKSKNVDDYIAHSVPEAHPVLQQLRNLIKAAVPEAEEGISWGVPFYKYKGPFAGFATYKNHVSFGIATGTLNLEEKKELDRKGYVTGKKTMKIRFDQKVPAAIIKRILKTRATQKESGE
ncbi:MAG: DUF1801 domain-containing protein [Bacteroidetes bacterium]|nr:DUF1801 domain-containing protein [Bacteroidota bacterium]